MNIKPIGNRVVVELLKQAQTTKSGFIISTEEKTEQQKGKVIAIGSGFGEEKDLMAEFTIGQTVLFGKYGGEEIKDETTDTTYKIINAKDILAILE
jgi:chaperonin GroES